jgi:beta-lactamase class A
VRKIFLIVLLIGTCNLCVAQYRTDKKLQKKIEALIQGFHGDIGIYVYNIKSKKVAGVNIDSVFPTASMVKVPILIGIMDKIEKGELGYRQELIYKDSLLYAGVDMLGSFKNDEKIELGKVIMLMLTMSDNTASLWLQSLAGTGLRINGILDSLGFRTTKVNSRTPGREEFRGIYGWGQTSPKEMVELFNKIYHHEIINKKASTQIMRLLGRNYWDEHAISAIPPTIQVFSKNGAVDASRSEVLLVNAPRTPYIFCICTKNNKDETWNHDNEAWVLTRKLSALLWTHFN